MLDRRTFLKSLLAGSAVAAGGLLVGCQSSTAIPLLSVARSRTEQGSPYSIRIFSEAAVQQVILPLPDRAHSLTLHPSGKWAVCHDRRPGRRLYVVDLEQRNIVQGIGS